MYARTGRNGWIWREWSAKLPSWLPWECTAIGPSTAPCRRRAPDPLWNITNQRERKPKVPSRTLGCRRKLASADQAERRRGQVAPSSSSFRKGRASNHCQAGHRRGTMMESTSERLARSPHDEPDTVFGPAPLPPAGGGGRPPIWKERGRHKSPKAPRVRLGPDPNPRQHDILRRRRLPRQHGREHTGERSEDTSGGVWETTKAGSQPGAPSWT